MLGERREEASRGPAFLVGLLGELGPHRFDGEQPQVGEEELDARGIDRIGRLQPSLDAIVPSQDKLMTAGSAACASTSTKAITTPTIPAILIRFIPLPFGIPHHATPTRTVEGQPTSLGMESALLGW